MSKKKESLKEIRDRVDSKYLFDYEYIKGKTIMRTCNGDGIITMSFTDGSWVAFEVVGNVAGSRWVGPVFEVRLREVCHTQLKLLKLITKKEFNRFEKAQLKEWEAEGYEIKDTPLLPNKNPQQVYPYINDTIKMYLK